ncbi:MAG: glycosyltransferase [Bacteroidota bacterium]
MTQQDVIHSLWIGTQLSHLELLTLRSFVAHGHDFQLWVYDELETEVPEGVTLQDANEILDRKHIFRYREGDIGKGSVAGFSDIFRYKLLYEKGGWWVDMDVTCLRPFEFDTPYVFRQHDFLPVVGNIMKASKGSPAMKAAFEEALASVDEFNTDWLKPIGILNRQIAQHKLTKYIRADLCNPDRWELVTLYRESNLEPNDDWYAIHWINVEWNRRHFARDMAVADSLYYRLLQQYELPVSAIFPLSRWQHFYLKYRAKLIISLPNSWRVKLKELWTKN